MRITKADSVLCAIMFTSLVGAHAMVRTTTFTESTEGLQLRPRVEEKIWET